MKGKPWIIQRKRLKKKKLNKCSFELTPRLSTKGEGIPFLLHSKKINNPPLNRLSENFNFRAKTCKKRNLKPLNRKRRVLSNTDNN
ncbi:MAG: hypothetical protein PHV51_02755, partial [Methanosarcinaceae archaeon]|nr:hypothetical protein [Methanosarcinaceae archaeon]